MLKYELAEDNSNYTAYKYYPEEKGKPGFLAVSKTSKEILRMDLAPEDEFKWYAMKSYKRIKVWMENRSIPQTGNFVWY